MKGLEMMGIVEGILVTDRLHEPRLYEATAGPRRRPWSGHRRR